MQKLKAFKLNYLPGAKSITIDFVIMEKGNGNVNDWVTLAYSENYTSFVNAGRYAVYEGVFSSGYISSTGLRKEKRRVCGQQRIET